MTAVERFEEWIKENPDEITDIIKKARQSLNMTAEQVWEKILELKRWLIANEGTQKVNKKAWKRFIIKNLGKGGNYARIRK